MTTKITTAGIAAATRARNNQGPRINITSFKIGSSITPPVGNETDIVGDLVYIGFPSQLQYAVVNDNTVQYIVTLDESVPSGSPNFFYVGRIGLFTDNGDGTSSLFSITSIDATSPDYKFATTPTIVGNRLSYNIYLAISDMANIANFTIQLLDLLTIPEVTSELALPPPDGVAFNTYQVMKHSVTRIPAIAFRETATQGRVPSAWLMGSERLIPGQGEGVVPLDPSYFDTLASVGRVVGLDSTNQRIIIGEPATNRYILGIRSSQEEISNYGVYVDSSPGIAYAPMAKIYADTAPNAGGITLTANQWPIGYALGPVNTTNAVGYALWIDFTMGFGAIGTPGPQGPPGPPGPSGSAGPGGGGGGGGFSNTGQCYLTKSVGNLLLSPYNGNNIIINSTVQSIPAGGVSLPAAGLQTNTLYYIYAFMNGTTMAMEASTTNHITSTFDGVEIKNLDQSRTLVGMAYTISGPAWSDQDGQLYVLSWFNPKSKSGTTYFTAYHTTGGNDFVELGTEIRNYFLTWANRNVKYVTGGFCGCNGGNGVATVMCFDGNAWEKYSLGANENGNRPVQMQGPIGVLGVRSNLSEGLHFGTLKGVQWGGGPGVAYWNLTLGTATHPSSPSNPSGGIDTPVSLTVTVEG
jgi:hypothetical protein